MKTPNRARELLELWRQVLRLLKYSSRRLSILVGIVTIAEAVFTILGVWLIKVLIDALSQQQQITETSSSVFLFLGFAGLAIFATLAAQAYGNLLRTQQGLLVADYVDRQIHDRAIHVDLSFYESPAYFDSLQRARQSGTQRPAQMVSGALLLLKNIVLLCAVLAMLAGIEWRLLPVFLMAVVIALVVRVYFTRRIYEWQFLRAQLERRSSYFDWLLTSDHHAKELRLYDLGQYFREAYSILRRDIRTQQIKIESSKALAEVGIGVVGAGTFVGAVAFLLGQAVSGTFSLGDIVLFVLLFRRAQQSGKETVSSLSQMFEHQLYLRQLFSFLEAKPTILTPAEPKPIPRLIERGLIMKNVSFRYNDTNHNALTDVNLELPPGKLIALVGENGSGKTTLIKLLTRLYDPSEGCITLDGVDVREFDPGKYRNLFSVIFQDFSKYAATAAENIWFGDINHPRNDERIIAAGDRAGASPFLEKLQNGYDTPLSRVFDDGQELSIGQWQRVALGRALLPDTRFIIMDEPTSAIDPRAEMEIFDTLRDRIGDRGALIISHRLSTIRHADYTYVLDSGRIVENGTHDELVATRGHYADMFERQGRNFQVHDR